MGFEKLSMTLCCRGSYRSACEILNAALHREGNARLAASTLSEHAAAQGNAILTEQCRMAEAILENHGISWENGLPREEDGLPGNVILPMPEAAPATEESPAVIAAIADYNRDRPAQEQIRDAGLISRVEQSTEDCVYISMDDVGVKHQKECRRGNGKAKTAAVVENTVVHVQHAGKSYLLTAVGMFEAMRLLLAFLLGNGLLRGKRLVFFSDGAQNIRAALERHFAFYPYELLLDWYHLEKRMTELLSMALRGEKRRRHEMRRELDGILWAGNMGEAINYLRAIGTEYVKNRERLDEAVAYLERKKPYIYCYALRARLKYRNSSNPAEKANDLVVAQRQKHNGMSWSFKGSGALAVISALIRNGEADTWIQKRTITFNFYAAA